jgi:hypothetical protein
VAYAKINLIIPTRGRASTKLPCFIESFKATALSPDSVYYTFVVDEDDTETMEYLVARNDINMFVVFNAPGPPHLAGLMNKGFDMSPWKGEGWVYGYIGDDFVSATHGWDAKVLDAANRCRGRRCIWGFDGYLNDLPTYYFMPDALWRAMGTDTWVYPHAGMELTDLITRDTLVPLGLMLRLPDLTLEHRHSSRPEIGQDETFARLQKADNSKATAKDVGDYIKKCQESIRAAWARSSQS